MTVDADCSDTHQGHPLVAQKISFRILLTTLVGTRYAHHDYRNSHSREVPMSPQKKALGTTEIEVLRYLGDHPKSTVGETADHFARTSGQARTTILTIMERLRGKGYLTRKQAEGVYRYSAKRAKGELLRGLVKTFVDKTLGGSVSPVVAYLAEEGPVTDDDLAQLKQLVRDLERAKKGNAP
jgi:predicted transcriptional regulator